ncbi:lysophospholipase [Cubamyces sp. BRFM 1775]|nr:lysophospholipase [Cubamyces sp. BRFM 1775]
MDQASHLTYEESWVPGGGDLLRFYTRTYPARTPLAALIFVHGFTEHVSRYEWAHSLLASRGILVFAYDQRGFGRTALDTLHKSEGAGLGRTSWLALLADIGFWITYVKMKHPTVPIFAMGHSMGGALLLDLATSNLLPSYVQESARMLSGIIASSPFLAQTEPLAKPLRHVVAMASKALPTVLVNTELPHSYLSRDADVIMALSRDPLVKQKSSMRFVTEMLDAGEHLLQLKHLSVPCGLSVLVLHGTADRITSFTASKQFFDSLDAADKAFVDIPYAYHELVHEPHGVKEEYMDRCIDWVLSHSASCHSYHE